MASRDMVNCCTPKRAISPAAATTNDTAWVSEIIDTQGYESLTFILMIGALDDANATFTVLIEDGDNSSLTDNAAVADTFLIGTEALAGFTYADDNECRKIGYVGGKRYVRMTVTPSGNTGNAFLSAVALLGHPLDMPTDNPPA